jgi:glutathione S-transferase
MSIKLYGFPLSNYYNMIKAVMLEKEVAFTEVLTRPGKTDANYLDLSPMGKVPALETEQGGLSETGVMMDYIDAIATGGPRLYPEDPFKKAKVQELMRYLELYIELPARQLYGEVFFGSAVAESLREVVRGKLEKGFAALGRLARYDPYLAGSDLSYADFYFCFSFNLATAVCKKALDWDAFNEFGEARALLKLMNERESVKRCLADQS